MKIRIALLLLTVLVVVAEDTSSKLRVKRSTVANDVVTAARSKIGQTQWSKANTRTICLRSYRNEYKCNIFVADMFRDAGGSVPMRRSWCYSPIGADQWANSHSTYLTGASCWSHVTSPQNGDVAGFNGHVGIVTGNRLTTSAATNSVVENDWGFRSGHNPVFWRYTC